MSKTQYPLDCCTFFQTKARSEVFALRLRLSREDPVVLAAAGKAADAAAATVLRRVPVATSTLDADTDQADEDMDVAAEWLALGRSREALPLLIEAGKVYYRAGGRTWDLADALWNLGYCQYRSARPAALNTLARAGKLLATQGRLVDAAQCLITLATAALASGRIRVSLRAVAEADRLASSLCNRGLDARGALLMGCVFARVEQPSAATPALLDCLDAVGIPPDPILQPVADECRRTMESVLRVCGRRVLKHPADDLLRLVRQLTEMAPPPVDHDRRTVLLCGLRLAVALNVTTGVAAARLASLARGVSGKSRGLPETAS